MYSVDPERVYVNLSATANASTTDSFTDPVAQYAEKRTSAILSDASKYKLAVARCDITGLRNLPVFIPSIAEGANNPLNDINLTNYQITYTTSVFYMTVGEGYYPFVPTASTQSGILQGLVVSVFQPSGACVVKNCKVPVPRAGITNCDQLAVAVQTALSTVQGLGLVDTLQCKNIPLILPDGSLDPEAGQLQFFWLPATMTAFPGYEFSVDFINADPTADNENPYTFGFPIVPNTYGNHPKPTGTYTVRSTGSVLLMPNVALTSNQMYHGPIYFTATQSLEWTSEQINGPAPVALDDPYYWASSYSTFVSMFNAALRTCWLSVCGQAAATALPIGTVLPVQTQPIQLQSQCPFLAYNESSKTFSLYGDSWSFTNSGTPRNLGGRGGDSKFLYLPNYQEYSSISFNEILQDLLMLPVQSVDQVSGNVLIEFDDAALVTATPNTAVTMGNPANLGRWSVCTNDTSPVGSMWSPIGSLVFLTRFFPIRPEYVSTPTTYTDTNIGTSQIVQTGSDSSQILSDVVPAIADAADWTNSMILYNPTILRWVDMPCGAFQLDTVDFTLGWKNRLTGKVKPVYLNPLAAFSVKILLQRKDVLL